MSEKRCLRLTRVIKAPRAKCFEIWTDPQSIARWITPGSMTVSKPTADVRVGGEYRIAMTGESETGKPVSFTIMGVFQEVVPNERITFTWRITDEPHPDTTVSVEFKEVEQGTELTLTHYGFEDEAARADHEEGWKGCLDKMEQFLENADFARTVTISAPCETVFDALATVEGPKGWWTSLVSGSAETGGRLSFAFQGVEGQALMHVDHATRPRSVQWTCAACDMVPDWVNTVIVFELVKCTPNSCELNFPIAA